MKEKIDQFDASFITWAGRHAEKISRIALFVVFFWFGILKVIGLSPATPLVSALFDKTIYSFISFNLFYIFFGCFEMLIGILFLIPRLTRLAIVLLFLHLITTILPLIILPSMSWTHPFVPTLEGQYIIKNILIIAIAIVLVARTDPLVKKQLL